MASFAARAAAAQDLNPSRVDNDIVLAAELHMLEFLGLQHHKANRNEADTKEVPLFCLGRCPSFGKQSQAAERSSRTGLCVQAEVHVL